MAYTAGPERKAHVLAYREMRKEGGVLEHEADGPLFWQKLAELSAIEADESGCGRAKAGDRFEQHRLAGTRGPKDRKHAVALHG